MKKKSEEDRETVQSWEALPLKERLKLALILFVFIVTPFLATLFMFFIFIPVHEIGHALACLAFGVRIYKIEWWRITIATPADWRVEAIIRYSGGLFAALCLSIIYILFSRFTTWGMSQVTRRRNLLHLFVTSVKTALLTDFMLEFTNGILEGTVYDIYVQISKNIKIMWVIIFFFFLISLGIHISKARPLFTTEGSMHVAKHK